MHIIELISNTGNIYHLELCDRFSTKLMGLMFRKQLSSGQGLLFDYPNESIINTSIHMFFMNFPISVIWLNQQNIVVDKKIALPWRPYYASSTPASKIIESDISAIDDFIIGEPVRLTYEK